MRNLLYFKKGNQSMKTAGHILILSLFLFCMIGTIIPSRADAIYGRQMSTAEGCIAFTFLGGVYLEPFIPDLRFEGMIKNGEINGFGDAVVLSWPLHYWFYNSDNIKTSLFIEPQWKPYDHAARGLLGSRFSYEWASGFKYLMEGGGLLGKNDGNGGFIGSGIGWVVAKNWNLALIFRTSITDKEIRYDICLDFWTNNYFEL